MNAAVCGEYRSHLSSLLRKLYEKKLPTHLSWSKDIQPDRILTEIHEMGRGAKRRSEDDLLILQYINEVWLSELSKPKGVDTLEICAGVVDRQWDIVKSHLEPAYGQELANKMVRKLKNLLGELERLFLGDNYQDGKAPRELSVSFIKEIHSNIMSGLLDSTLPGPGEYRVKDSRPSKSTVLYLRPKFIKHRLEVLIKFVNEKASEVRSESSSFNQRNERLILLGALLFSEFLFIHPFCNGNGRVARLVLNSFLSDVCEVPFSLYLSGGRKLYLDVLEETHSYRTEPPLELAGFILLTIQRQVAYLAYQNLDSE